MLFEARKLIKLLKQTTIYTDMPKQVQNLRCFIHLANREITLIKDFTNG